MRQHEFEKLATALDVPHETLHTERLPTLLAAIKAQGIAADEHREHLEAVFGKPGEETSDAELVAKAVEVVNTAALLGMGQGSLAADIEAAAVDAGKLAEVRQREDELEAAFGKDPEIAIDRMLWRFGHERTGDTWKDLRNLLERVEDHAQRRIGGG